MMTERTMTPIVVLGVFAFADATAHADTLYDNGMPDGTGGYSNGTADVFGFRRTLLDDFTVPDGGWTISDFHWLHVWNTLPPGSGTGAELTLWSDASGAPGTPFLDLTITSYNEIDTGVTWFSRGEAKSWVTFDEVSLDAGTYWIEWAIIGPQNNFVLTAALNETNECWVNYEDLGGLRRGSEQFGVPAEMSWSLTGVPGPAAIGLLAIAGLSAPRRRER